MGVRGKATPRPLYPRERDLAPIVQEVGGPQRRSGRLQKIWPPTGIGTQNRVPHRETLHRLGYAGPQHLNACFYITKHFLISVSHTLQKHRLHSLYLRTPDFMHFNWPPAGNTTNCRNIRVLVGFSATIPY
jgi:hypothetical protein